MEPSVVPVVVVSVAVLSFGVAVLVALALDRPDPGEAALAYEEAWDRLDFDLLWRLSAPEMREGRDRDEFVAAKASLYEERADLAGLVERVEVVTLDRSGTAARAVTRLTLRDGEEFHDELRLRLDAGRWVVVAYRLGDAGRDSGIARPGAADRARG